jgi:hypothetical protein
MLPAPSSLGSKIFHGQNRKIVASICDFMGTEARSKDKLSLSIHIKETQEAQKRMVEASEMSGKTHQNF